MPRHDTQALVQLGPELADLTGVLGQRLLLPRQGDGAQGGDEGVGRGEDDPLVEGVVLQRRVGVEQQRAPATISSGSTRRL